MENKNSDITILTDFNAIIDVDLAILKMIQDKYNNPQYIDQNIMCLSLHDVKEALLNRDNENPLSICIHDNDVAKSVYEDILNNNIEEAMSDRYRTPTGVLKLMMTLINNGGYCIKILCRDEFQKSIIEKYSDKLNPIIEPDLSKVDLKEYSIFFFKSASKVMAFGKPFINKHIFLCDYKFNSDISPDGVIFPNIYISRQVLQYNSKLGFVNTYSKNENIHLNY